MYLILLPSTPGKSCWQFWNKVLIHPSSFLSTRRRVVTCWPSLWRRWGYVWQAEQSPTLALPLSDARDAVGSVGSRSLFSLYTI